MASSVTTLLHYRVLEKIGEGGMGVVYRAIDTRLDREVALKLMPPDSAADPDRKRRFMIEARAASALNHPNIVTIHDVASADGTDFLVMEYVRGDTLSARIRQAPMPVSGCRSVGHPDRGRVGQGALGGHRPSRPEAVQHHDHAGWPREGDGFRAGQAGRNQTDRGLRATTRSRSKPRPGY
jgi:serine/threonine protein kinase